MGTRQIIERIQHGYDRAGNRIWRAQLADPNRRHDEFYHYDGLHRLVRMQRGTLNAGKTGMDNPTFGQCWSPDAAGNFNQFNEDKDGNGKWDIIQRRTANKKNEITSIKSPVNGLPMRLPAPLGTVRTGRSAGTQPRYDRNGNLTTDEHGNTLIYDAWNRLVRVKDAENNVIFSTAYDGLGRRVQQTVGSETRDFYFSEGRQVLEERVGGNARAQNVWSQVYVDAMILRDWDSDGNGSLQTRHYVTHDANFNTAGLVDDAGNVTERFGYAPYGVRTILGPDFDVRGNSSFAWVHGHQGKRLEASIGAYDFDARWYSPTLSRFLSPDPVRFANNAVNHYAFVLNNPLSLVDPTGTVVPLVVAGLALPEVAALAAAGLATACALIPGCRNAVARSGGAAIDQGIASARALIAGGAGYSAGRSLGAGAGAGGAGFATGGYGGGGGFGAGGGLAGGLGGGVGAGTTTRGFGGLGGQGGGAYNPGGISYPNYGTAYPGSSFGGGFGGGGCGGHPGSFGGGFGGGGFSGGFPRSPGGFGGGFVGGGFNGGRAVALPNAPAVSNPFCQGMALAALGISRADCLAICVQEYTACIMRLPGRRCGGCLDICRAHCYDPKLRSNNPWPNKDTSNRSCKF